MALVSPFVRGCFIHFQLGCEGWDSRGLWGSFLGFWGLFWSGQCFLALCGFKG